MGFYLQRNADIRVAAHRSTLHTIDPPFMAVVLVGRTSSSLKNAYHWHPTSPSSRHWIRVARCCGLPFWVALSLHVSKQCDMSYVWCIPVTLAMVASNKGMLVPLPSKGVKRPPTTSQ